MTVYLRNKTRSCHVGVPANRASRKPGMRGVLAGGRSVYIGPGDAESYPDASVLNNLVRNAHQNFVFCEDPREMDELGVAAEHRAKDGKGFWGAHMVIEDCTREVEAEIGTTARLASTRRLRDLEAQAMEAEQAKTKLVHVQSEKDRVEAENKKLRDELAALRTASKSK